VSSSTKAGEQHHKGRGATSQRQGSNNTSSTGEKGKEPRMRGDTVRRYGDELQWRLVVGMDSNMCTSQCVFSHVICASLVDKMFIASCTRCTEGRRC
jgi:hypothetical protein